MNIITYITYCRKLVLIVPFPSGLSLLSVLFSLLLLPLASLSYLIYK